MHLNKKVYQRYQELNAGTWTTSLQLDHGVVTFECRRQTDRSDGAEAKFGAWDEGCMDDVWSPGCVCPITQQIVGVSVLSE